MRPRELIGTKAVWFTSILLTFCVRSYCQESQAVHVRVDAVTQETLQENYQVTGNLRAVSRAEVAAEEEGQLLSINVKEASTVSEGDIIARIDDKRLKVQLQELQAERRQTEADIELRQAELENAKRNLERLRPLIKTGMTTDKEFRDAETGVSVAHSRLVSIQRNLERVNNRIDLITIRLEDTIIKAPFDGRVVERFAEKGEWIRPGDPVVTLISIGIIESWLEIPERLIKPISELEDSLTLEVLVHDTRYQSIDARIIPQIDPTARTFMLVCDLPMDQSKLVPGSSVSAWVPVGKEGSYITIHKDSLIRQGTGFTVYKVIPGQENSHQVVPIPVTILFQTKTRAAIQAGPLQVGDRVVIEGNERLRPMAEVIPMNYDGKS